MEKLKVVPKPALSVTTNPTDLKRLQAIMEVLDHAFLEIEKIILSIQSRVDSIFSVIDSRPLVQLLVGIKKYVNSYIASDCVAQTETKAEAQENSANTSSDASLPQAKTDANRLLAIFRSLLNNVLMDLDSVTDFREANTLAVLGEKCREVSFLQRYFKKTKIY